MQASIQICEYNKLDQIMNGVHMYTFKDKTTSKDR